MRSHNLLACCRCPLAPLLPTCRHNLTLPHVTTSPTSFSTSNTLPFIPFFFHHSRFTTTTLVYTQLCCITLIWFPSIRSHKYKPLFPLEHPEHLTQARTRCIPKLFLQLVPSVAFSVWLLLFLHSNSKPTYSMVSIDSRSQ